MKNSLFILIFLFIPSILFSQKVEGKEISYINNAVQLAAKENKLLIIEFWAPSCGPCIRLKRDIFENKYNREFLNKNFLLVQVSPADSMYNSLWKYFKLEYQSSVIYMDKNGNEIDRTVGYDGDRNAYINFLKDVSEGKNLYNDIVNAYQKDTLDTVNNYLLANKLLFRYELNDALKQYNKVLLYDPEDRLGLYPECKYKIAESELMLTGNLEKMQEYIKTDVKNVFIPKAYEYLINDLLDKKDKKSCISLSEEAYNKYPDSWEILNKYAWAICTFKIKEDYEKALVMVQKSISLNPGRPGTYSTEAWIHFEMGDKEKAIQLQKKAIEIYPYPAYNKDLETFMKK
jgi:thioredoxin-related protein